MLEKFTNVIQGLEVFPNAMQENLDRAYGTWAGQRVKVALLDAGADSENVYRYIQDMAFQAMDQRVSMRALMRVKPLRVNPDSEKDAEMKTPIEVIDLPVFASLFDPQVYIRGGIETIFERFVV
jgi:adenylosuccinate lyase